MEDLDSLLEDLGRGKSSSSVKKQRPPSSRVDLNELEDLMEDLAAPTSKQAPEPTPAVKPQSVTISNNNQSNNAPKPVVQHAEPAPAPTPSNSATNGHATTSQSTSAPPPKPNTGGAVDDLDALMESLNASSSRSNRRPASTKPQPSSAPEPTPSPSSRPPATTNNNPPRSEPAPAPVQNKSTPPANNSRAPVKDDLDSLLNNLTQQMNNIDVSNPISRGACATCKGAILGEMIQALGKTFHPEHFSCGNCKNPLGSKSFYEYNGEPHCENCYQELFCHKCAHCDKPVLDRCITAMGKKWHPDHFICTQCLLPFKNGTFFERDGKPYCEQDFFGVFAPKCGSCNEPIRGDCINALGKQWHPEHFACAYCQKAFNGGTFFEYGGKPYCETHYHQQTGSLCSGCGKAILGRCVNALDKKWHPEHFVCAFCMNPLAGGSFTEHNNKAYCKECHGKLFGA